MDKSLDEILIDNILEDPKIIDYIYANSIYLKTLINANAVKNVQRPNFEEFFPSVKFSKSKNQPISQPQSPESQSSQGSDVDSPPYLQLPSYTSLPKVGKKPTKILYIPGVESSTKIRQYFFKFREVIDIRFIKKKDHSMAFIEFTDVASATAVFNKKIKIDDVLLKMEYASKP